MAGSSGFSIAITAVDNASKTFDGLNKRITTLNAPAERFNKALSKFGDTTGISRITESVRGLGAGAADAFRSLDRMASPLAAITSVGSIAGIAALTRRWAEFGNQIGQISYRLNMPVEKLGALRGAMRLAGGSAADADNGLRGLQETLNGAAWGRDSHAIQLFKTLGVNFGDAEHGARNANDALGDIAESIKNMPPATQARVLNESGLGEGMLPLLKNGRKGLEDFQKQAEQTGGVMTGQMVQNATAMNTAWQKLGLDVEGVGNRIVDSWSGTVTKVLENSSRWIENNKGVADSVAKIGAGVTLLAAIKPALWVLRILGLSSAAGVAGSAATLASPLLLSGDTPSDPALNQPPADPGFMGQGGTLERWVRGLFGGNSTTGSPTPITAPRAPSAAAGTMQRMHDFFRGKGLDEQQTAGILANAAPESGFDPTKWGDGGTSYGLFQLHADRLTGMQTRYGTRTPNEQQQLEYAWSELNTTERPTLDRMMAVHNASRNAAIFSSGFERPAGGLNEALRRGQAADQFVQQDTPLAPLGRPQTATKGAASVADAPYLQPGDKVPGYFAPDAGSTNGHVQVDVHIKGAPAGTTSKVATSGPVSAPPPRIETPMPMVN